MALDKKGFDNLVNKEQAEQQTKEEDGTHDQENNPEKPKAMEAPPSCEHQDQRERLGTENKPEQNQEKDGIMDATAAYKIKPLLHLTVYHFLSLKNKLQQFYS